MIHQLLPLTRKFSKVTVLWLLHLLCCKLSRAVSNQLLPAQSLTKAEVLRLLLPTRVADRISGTQTRSKSKPLQLVRKVMDIGDTKKQVGSNDT